MECGLSHGHSRAILSANPTLFGCLPILQANGMLKRLGELKKVVQVRWGGGPLFA